ncbi:hypothetical protein BU25DRAFT_415409 [Macroventuria anomochaeta]|uniref:Uncharacterized protein n=1 Tax=Macroventuria anomochaeta TaxID=301207 RepID=A0ACB6RM72_9PLEO|nr:uncharacterized protein BU25DRAFT_415409 [Macroventuria anomochaeta]KAF2622259.1 hypothetical protein BU25DRAFT_415409 [Macroventuria anomochaeta]
MTSNKPVHLDEALIRAGRIDRDIYFEKVTKETPGMIFERMYTDLEEPNFERLTKGFKSAIPNDELTAAGVQGYLIAHSSPKEAAEQAAGWIMAKQVRRDERTTRLVSSGQGRPRSSIEIPQQGGQGNGDRSEEPESRLAHAQIWAGADRRPRISRFPKMKSRP